MQPVCISIKGRKPYPTMNTAFYSVAKWGLPKTAEEMAAQYGFDEEQKEQLAELLNEENRSLWSAVLYGIYTEDGAIVSVALSQVGNVGGEPYWSWYGFSVPFPPK